VDTQLFIDVLAWFVKESGHPGYTNTSIPEDCPQPLLVKDTKVRNNTKNPTNETVEANFEGGTYFFSSTQDPSGNTLVYGSTDRFAVATFNCSAPTLLAYGGTYANNVEMKLKIFCFCISFWYWRPKDETKGTGSLGLCIQMYM
jgi:hypothetical protein